jgi:hypothetical protein
MLNLSNTTVKGAMGNKSRLIRTKVLLELTVQQYKADIVMLVIPSLTRDCILGMNMLKEGGCVINIPHKQIQFHNNNNNETSENPIIANVLSISAQQESQQEEPPIDFTETVNQITTINQQQKQLLNEILENNREIFTETPGRISGYEHEIRVTDTTPYCQKGWPVPLAYQQKVDAEIRLMLQYGVIERSNSQYINSLP